METSKGEGTVSRKCHSFNFIPTIIALSLLSYVKRTAAHETNDFQARFSDDGASVTISFSPNGSASSGLLNATDLDSGSGPGSCDALLDASTVALIGDGAECT